jgi:nitrite reductase (NO-forming)
MQPRDTMRLYQTAARIWLAAAGLSLLLPAAVREGWWVPLHLMLLGAVSVAISGAMQNFVAALTATGSTTRSTVWAQFGLTNTGAALIVVGRTSGLLGLVAAGGTAFLAGILLLGVIVLRARRRAVHLRHRIPVAMYGGAVACVLVGAGIGVLLGTGAVGDPQTRLDLRSAHMVVNVLGWDSLTIAGTLITLLPTVLRVRMPAWHGELTAALFVFGVGMTATGLALGVTPLAVTGAAAFAAGVAGLLAMVRRVLSAPRKWPVPVSAKHLMLAVGWFAVGALWLLVALIRGAQWFAGADDLFVILFAGGWILQTLLGAWQYLLPVTRPGHPDERRAWLAAMEWGGTVQLVALNIGLVLLALAASRSGASVLATVGAALALVGATMALIKSWTYPILGRSSVLTQRSRPMWDPRARLGERSSDVPDRKP